MTETVRQLEVPSAQLSYRRAGSGPGVLLIQGVGVIGDGWRPQIDGLCDRYTTISFDNRGLGASTLRSVPAHHRGDGARRAGHHGRREDRALPRRRALDGRPHRPGGRPARAGPREEPRAPLHVRAGKAGHPIDRRHRPRRPPDAHRDPRHAPKRLPRAGHAPRPARGERSRPAGRDAASAVRPRPGRTAADHHEAAGGDGEVRRLGAARAARAHSVAGDERRAGPHRAPRVRTRARRGHPGRAARRAPRRGARRPVHAASEVNTLLAEHFAVAS